MHDSRGYEAIAEAWLAQRGSAALRNGAIGAEALTQWAHALPPGSSVIDVGCGPGLPLTALLVEAGLNVYGIDASPTLVAAFRKNLPGVPVAYASALHFHYFNRTFDAVLAIGLIFLLAEDDQIRLLEKFASILAPNGRVLFTAPAQACTWQDAMTGTKSVSLGAEAYTQHLQRSGLTLHATFQDEGGNHYFDARKIAAGNTTS